MASAVPLYQESPVRICGGTVVMYSPHSGLKIVQPSREMFLQRRRLVLGENQDAAQSGVQAIGKRKVDDAIFAAEAYGRLGPLGRERMQARADAPGEDNGEGFFQHYSAIRFLVLLARCRYVSYGLLWS